MKKTWVSYFFLVLAGLIFPAYALANSIFIEGTALTQSQHSFFMENFRLEAVANGYAVAESRAQAGFTFRFDVVANMITYDDGSQAPAPPEEGSFLIMIFLTRNTDNAEIASFGFAFSDIGQMDEYIQFLFFRAVANIPSDGPQLVMEHGGPVLVQEIDGRQVHFVVQERDDWRNKWLYFRASIDYQIRFYLLQQDSTLFDGIAVYDGDKTSPTRIRPLDNRFMNMPGVTFGLEFQFLDFMSLEPVFQLSMGDPEKMLFFNMLAGAQLKGQIKSIRGLVFAPYGAFLYPLNKSSAFDEFPQFALGGGLQMGFRAGNIGSFFFDINYTHYLGVAGMNNWYVGLYPNPPVINFRHFVIGLGAGYKYGLFDRRR